MAFLRPEPTNLRERLAAFTRREWLFALAALAVTATVVVGFLVESRSGYSALERPRLVYTQSWPASGSLADIQPALPAAAEPTPTP